MKIDKKPEFAAVIVSVVALGFSLINFTQTQADRDFANDEQRPRINFSYLPYGLNTEYGFYIKNTGGQRAQLVNVLLTYNNLNQISEAKDLLKKLDFKYDELFLLAAGPNTILEPGEEHYFYISNKKLDENQHFDWEALTSKLAADICYCDVAFTHCWTKRVTRLANSQPSSDFKCDAKVHSALSEFRGDS